MRNKLLVGATVVAVGFLLATNPVIVNAAGTITGAEIKNNSLTGKDVKNGSLKSADFGAGQIPAGPAGPAGSAGGTGPQGPTGPTAPFHRIAAPISAVAANNTANWQFIGPTASVTLTTGQGMAGAITSSLQAASTDAVDIALCRRLEPGGMVLPMAADWHIDIVITTALTDHTFTSLSHPLAAGNYTVGTCVSSHVVTLHGDYAAGYVQVVPASAVPARPSGATTPTARAAE